MEFIETKRDGQNLCLDGYVYTVKNSKHGVVTWRCVRRQLGFQRRGT